MQELATKSQEVATVTYNIFDPVCFDNMQRACKMLASSDLVPDLYRDIPGKNSQSKAIANCMIALEMAQRTGASFLAVMQNMVIIHGKPSWASQFLISTVNTCGRFEPLKFRFNEAKTECTAWTRERGSDDILEGTTITLDMAQREGWSRTPGSKWATMPQQMLMYRAAAFWTRVYAPELSMGMHTIDENTDIAESDAAAIVQQVRDEIASHANGTAIVMDDLMDTSDTVVTADTTDTMVVDTATGEIQAPAAKPAAEKTRGRKSGKVVEQGLLMEDAPY